MDGTANKRRVYGPEYVNDFWRNLCNLYTLNNDLEISNYMT